MQLEIHEEGTAPHYYRIYRMARRAIVISTADKAEARLLRFLSFLGIEWEALTAQDLLRKRGSEIKPAEKTIAV